jgi:Asp-tRNA(Asn)/Glu-tRNA(Gln) amidotransferase A subunit family amidase
LTNICFKSAVDLAAAIRLKELSPVEVVLAHLGRISERQPEINAYTEVLEESARAEAARAERAVMSGEPLGPLHGVPVAIKDAETKAGARNTLGSRALATNVAQATSLHVERLEAAGAIVLGLTNLPEFGHKGATDNLLFGPTSTPFARGKNAGGSSGGSAAAVADGCAVLATGGDGGGSIRIPASFCGVYGFKPTYGTVPTVNRPNAYASFRPMGHVGPLARTVEDAALMLDVMAGWHPGDPLSIHETSSEFRSAERLSVNGMRAAYSATFGGFPVEPAVQQVVESALAGFRDAGIVVEEVDVDFGHPHQAITTLWREQQAVGLAVFAEILRTERGIDLLGEQRSELCEDVATAIEWGRSISAYAIDLGDQMRTAVFDELERVLEDFDVLITPTVGVPPFDNAVDGTTTGPSFVNDEDVDPLIGWCLTHPLNFTGHPAASIPAGLTLEGLPVGAQIIGRRFSDKTVFAVSAGYESVRPWSDTYDRVPA